MYAAFKGVNDLLKIEKYVKELEDSSVKSKME